VLARAAGGGKLEAARAFGIAVVAPFGVRLAVGGQRALAALVGLLEAVRVNQRQILLGYAKQELQAIARLVAQLLAAHALRHPRRVRPRLPGEEHRPLLVGEQAEEGELRARRVRGDDRAVASE